jgi:hypothetical protein
MYRRLMLLIAGALVLTPAAMVSCTGTATTPEATVEPTPVSVSTYIATVETTLDFIDDTVEIAAEASVSLSNNEITLEDYKNMAIAGKQNIEVAEKTIKEIAPPSEHTSIASFTEVHEDLLKAIDNYKKAFDEMIKYGNKGRLSYIRKATDLIENYANPYINVVITELRILKKEFLK